MRCKQAKRVMAIRPSGEIPQELESHLTRCERCRHEFVSRRQLSEGLAALRRATSDLEPSPGVERRVLAALARAGERPQRSNRRWIWPRNWIWPRSWIWPRNWIGMTAGMLLCAAGLLGFLLLRPAAVRYRSAAQPAVVETAEAPFTAMPYVIPPAPYERTSVVRTAISLETMAAAGFAVHGGESGAKTQADVVYGEDGRILAIRLVPNPDGSTRTRMD